MNALVGGVLNVGKLLVLAGVVVAATSSLGQDTPRAQAAHTQIFFSKQSTGTNPTKLTSVVFLVGAPPIQLYVWAKNIDEPTGMSAFQVDLAYNSDRLQVPSMTLSSTFLKSTNRTASCPPATLDVGHAYSSCVTFQVPPPYGPQGTGLLGSITVGPTPGSPPATSILSFTADTKLAGTPFDINQLWNSIIPTTKTSLFVRTAPCADFNPTPDGWVTITDIAILVSHFGEMDGNPLYDLDANTVVNTADIAIAVAEFGKQCPL